MKKLIFALLFVLPFISKAQAHLGSSLASLKTKYPEKKFEIEYTESGLKYTTAEHLYGSFIYYFDKETGLTFICIQIPDNLIALNAQVEEYNKKYVILSETSWRAYLEDGGIMNIKLTYNEENKTSFFRYTN